MLRFYTVWAESRHILANLIRGKLQPQVPEELQAIYRPSVQPYLISLLRQNPAENFAALHIPALIVQGTHDAQVSPDNAEVLKQAEPDAELALMHEPCHAYQRSVMARTASLL